MKARSALLRASWKRQTPRPVICSASAMRLRCGFPAWKRSWSRRISEKRSSPPGWRRPEQRLSAVTEEREALAAKRAALSGQENELQLSLLAAEKDRQAHAETIESLERRRAGHLARAEELCAEIAGVEEKNRALAEEKAELETQAHTLRGQSGGSKEEIEGYIAKRNELEARSSKLRLMERAEIRRAGETQW